MKCEICGRTDDLFSHVAQERACSLCVVGFGMKTPVTTADVARVRAALGIKADEYREVSPGAEAATLLGMRR